ncbi:MAG: hypothetical protein HRU17_13325 [Polyangiaceae bacterium]|nr:hypothetical protein [Polyangiaceae bacterium]
MPLLGGLVDRFAGASVRVLGRVLPMCLALGACTGILNIDEEHIEGYPALTTTDSDTGVEPDSSVPAPRRPPDIPEAGADGGSEVDSGAHLECPEGMPLVSGLRGAPSDLAR